MRFHPSPSMPATRDSGGCSSASAVCIDNGWAGISVQVAALDLAWSRLWSWPSSWLSRGSVTTMRAGGHGRRQRNDVEPHAAPKVIRLPRNTRVPNLAVRRKGLQHQYYNIDLYRPAPLPTRSAVKQTIDERATPRSSTHDRPARQRHDTGSPAVVRCVRCTSGAPDNCRRRLHATEVD